MRPASRKMLMAITLMAGATCAAQAEEGKTVRELPGAHGRSFAQLDDYLVYLKERGASDHPYYELQPDGRYLHVRGRGTMNDPRYFSRKQLLEKFGFAQ